MPFYALGNLTEKMPARARDRFDVLQELTVVGGPFSDRATATAFLEEHPPLVASVLGELIGVPPITERYVIAERCDSVAARFAAVGLLDPGQR
jgi:hypothetical protein